MKRLSLLAIGLYAFVLIIVMPTATESRHKIRHAKDRSAVKNFIDRLNPKKKLNWLKRNCDCDEECEKLSVLSLCGGEQPQPATLDERLTRVNGSLRGVGSAIDTFLEEMPIHGRPPKKDQKKLAKKLHKIASFYDIPTCNRKCMNRMAKKGGLRLMKDQLYEYAAYLDDAVSRERSHSGEVNAHSLDMFEHIRNAINFILCDLKSASECKFNKEGLCKVTATKGPQEKEVMVKGTFKKIASCLGLKWRHQRDYVLLSEIRGFLSEIERVIEKVQGKHQEKVKAKLN